MQAGGFSNKKAEPIPNDGLSFKSISKAFGFPQDSNQINAKNAAASQEAWWKLQTGGSKGGAVSVGRVNKSSVSGQENSTSVKSMITSILNKEINQT